MKHKVALASLLLGMFSSHIYAGLPPPSVVSTTSTNHEHRVYAGLVWSLKEQFSLIPDATLGFRSVRVKSNDNVSGGDISARISFNNGIAIDSTRLSYVGGNRDILGNLGIGYSNAHSTLLGTVAVQGPYSRLGTDFEFADKKFVPYLEVLTVDKPNRVRDGISCPINNWVYYDRSTLTYYTGSASGRCVVRPI